MHSSSFRDDGSRPIVSLLKFPSETTETHVSELSKALRERAEDSISQLRRAVAEFKNVCYANSLGSESMVLTDLIWESVPRKSRYSASIRGGCIRRPMISSSGYSDATGGP